MPFMAPPFPHTDGHRSDHTWLAIKHPTASPPPAPRCYNLVLGLTLNCRADSEVAEDILSYQISLQPVKDQRLPRNDASDVAPLSCDELVA